MSSFHNRPHFQHISDRCPEEFQKFITEAIDKDSGKFELQSFPGFVILRILENDRHFWSPRLNVSFEGNDEGGTLVQGVYGPNANVWSLFVFAYLIIGFLGIISGVLTISQWIIESEAWGIWPLSFALVCLLSLYVIAQIGQKLGVQQTFLLHHAYESAVSESVSVH